MQFRSGYCITITPGSEKLEQGVPPTVTAEYAYFFPGVAESRTGPESWSSSKSHLLNGQSFDGKVTWTFWLGGPLSSSPCQTIVSLCFWESGTKSCFVRWPKSRPAYCWHDLLDEIKFMAALVCPPCTVGGISLLQLNIDNPNTRTSPTEKAQMSLFFTWFLSYARSVRDSFCTTTGFNVPLAAQTNTIHSNVKQLSSH